MAMSNAERQRQHRTRRALREHLYRQLDTAAGELASQVITQIPDDELRKRCAHINALRRRLTEAEDKGELSVL